MGFLATSIVLILFVWASYRVLRSINPGQRRKLPPGPYPFPIIGNILQLGKNPNQSLANLSKTYGPLMFLQLGSAYTVVVSSPDLAKKVLQEHDLSLSDRTFIAAVEAQGFHKKSLGFSPVGDRWRNLRKICQENIFSIRRLDESQELRSEKLGKLREHVLECARAGRPLNVNVASFVMSLNLLTTAFFSLDFAEFSSDMANELKETVEGVMKIFVAPNVADVFPVLKPLDPQGIKKQAGLYLGRLLGIFERIIDQRRQYRLTASPTKHDFLETLLENMNTDDIKFLLTDLLLGGTYSLTATVEWAMTELLLNPTKMAKTKNELKSVVSGENKQLAESDIPKLSYLQAVINETLRIHPPATFLMPRKAIREVEIDGYTIPKDTQIYVNVWAIGRDPSVWPDPTSFQPERFLDNSADYKGQDFRLIPFGSGRRICPAVPMVDRMLPIILASLIHNIDWKLEAVEHQLDTVEVFGIAVHKAVPLVAVPIYNE